MTVAQNVSSLKVEIVSFYVFGGMGAGARQFLIARFEREGADHAAVYLVLESEQVLGDSRELLTPKAVARGGIVQVKNHT